MVTFFNERTYQLSGLSTDEKPTLSSASNGSFFIEVDTGAKYCYDGENGVWIKVSK